MSGHSSLAQSWTFGILCFNEAGTIEAVIRKALHVLRTISKDAGAELIVIDDGSSDGSTEIIQKLENEIEELRCIVHIKNIGIGPSLRDVYKNATQENVIVFSGDGQFDSEELLATPIIGEKEVLAFYRMENTVYSLSRNLFSMFNRIINLIFLSLNYKDVNWAKGYKTEMLQKLNLQIKSSLVESEICSKFTILGFNKREIKSKYLPREYGESKGNSLLVVKKAIRDLPRIIILVNIFRIKLWFGYGPK